MESPHSILKKVFGYDSFRPGQEEIVSRLLAGQDVLAVMPTGGQVHLLSGAGPAAAGHHHRGLAAGEPDEGSGGGAGTGRCGGSLPEQQPDGQPEGFDAPPRPGGVV